MRCCLIAKALATCTSQGIDSGGQSFGLFPGRALQGPVWRAAARGFWTLFLKVSRL